MCFRFCIIKMKQCQSCGMPLSKDPSWQWWWTEKNGSISELYCSLCYRDGVFCYVWNDVEEFKNIVDLEMQKSDYWWFMRKMTRLSIPHLWRRKTMQPQSKLRFKRKTYGWWWTPVSRHGRVVLGVYLLLVLWRVIRYSRMAQQDQQQWEWTSRESDAWGNLVVALVPIFVLTLLLLLICYKKWETPKRQWWDKK